MSLADVVYLVEAVDVVHGNIGDQGRMTNNGHSTDAIKAEAAKLPFQTAVLRDVNPLETVAACLSAIAPKARKDEPGFSSPLWQVPVPGAKSLIPHIIAYGRNGFVQVSISTLVVERVSAHSDGLLVVMGSKAKINDSLHVAQMQRLIPYPNEAMKSLCLGRWTRFGSGEFRMDPKGLWPTFKVEGDGVRMTWPTPIEARWAGGWFRRRVKTSIESLLVLPKYGEVTAKGFIASLILPRPVWK